MWSILTPILIIGGIGLIAGAGLSIASLIFAVPVDKTAERVKECLPGANCGACGFSGCDGYATALSKGETQNTGLCSPGGDEVAQSIAEILGVETTAAVKKIAVIHCNGHRGNTETKMNYHGTKSCRTAKQLYGGDNACEFGCIGLGDCKKFCPFDAIAMENGFPKVIPSLCKGCGVCVSSCPKNLISLEEVGTTYTVRCRNLHKGAPVVKVRKVSCIGCGLCVKACESGAVTLENNCAVIDPENCTGCGKCAEACKRGAITKQ